MGVGAEASSGDDSGAAAVATAVTTATVHIRCSNGNKFSVQTELDSTVEAFKGTVAASCDVPAEQQRLIYKGRILKNDQTLASYGLESDHTIHLVRSTPPVTPPNTTPATNQAASPPQPAPGLAGSLFPGLGLNGLGTNNTASPFGSSFPDLEAMQQQLNQNPNMMRDVMNMPAVQSLMNNPDLMRNMIMNNPQMRDIIDRNPDLAHVLNDPSILRQTLEAARNPELMREMMRNTDRAMSNIESSPEGFNMLRRMYETVQEPFLNATSMAGAGEADAGANPFAALLGGIRPGANPPGTGADPTSPAPNTNPLPNPWGPNSGSGGGQAGARSTTPAANQMPPAGGLGGLAGLGGGGLPDLGSLLGGGGGGMPDANTMNQLLQNPAMMQMMQNMFSDPQMFNQMVAFNPTLRGLLDSNPQVREMMQNPDFMRQLMSPDYMQQIMNLSQSLQGLGQLGQLGQQQPNQEQNQPGGGAGMGGAANLDLLRNLLGGLGGGSFGAPPAQSNVPPEERYATQLTQLQEMGFIDAQENIRALTATSGNVHAAVERLLGNFGQ